jgi:hypothetical protein
MTTGYPVAAEAHHTNISLPVRTRSGSERLRTGAARRSLTCPGAGLSTVILGRFRRGVGGSVRASEGAVCASIPP